MAKVLFVCLGNICRSPMAEGLFIREVEKAGLSDKFEIDSAGTGGYHIGERADPRMRETASRHGLELTSRARQFVAEDFHRFDLVLPMDASNRRNVERLRPQGDGLAEVRLMREFDAEGSGLDVDDPYFGGPEGFEESYRVLSESAANLLAHLREKHGI